MKLKIENERTTTESTVNSNEPNQERYSKSSQPNKASGTKKRINKCDLGIDFVPPDGGWGWLVVIAAGCSNLVAFPVLQQFGLLFAERLKSIGLSASEITTIINLNSCLTSCVGLINGPMFRRFSYRQVGLFGAFLVAFAIFTTSISNSFLMYLLTFSVLYGAGSGINSSANSLALNTYFKKKRRIATGLSWTITGMGPIIMPQIIAIILPLYGIQGSLLIYTGLALNAVVCALVYQPVQWHVKKVFSVDENQIECDYCALAKQKGQNIFSPAYLYNADNTSIAGYEIIDPGTPMLSIANDGWSLRRSQNGSRASLYSNYPSRFGSRVPTSQNLLPSNRPSSANLQKERDKRKERRNQYKIEEGVEDDSVFRTPQDSVLPSPTTPTSTIPFRISIGPPSADTQVPNNRTSMSPSRKVSTTEHPIRKISTSNTFNLENEILKEASQKLEELVTLKKRNPTFTKLDGVCTCEEQRRQLLEKEYFGEDDEVIEEEEKHLTLWDKIAIFFDLDLLKDLTYVNLMVGVTLGAFTELNFSLLTPFILAEWGLEKPQIATAMSLLGGIDVTMRFFVPFIAGKIGWENKTFFLFGILSMGVGRILITFFQSYTAILIIFCWIGFGKGLRTVFMALVIPSYVPLNRLPAASGLQLLFAGIFYLVAGPVVGLIRDKTNYVVTLHCLNIPTFFVAICWTLEKLYRMREKRKNLKENVDKGY